MGKVIYQGKLSFIRSTPAMAVYGDETLKTQYIPKALLGGKSATKFPETLEFTITAPESRGPRAETPKGGAR